ncbi:YcaO-like family protein [Roseomonas elaeocarpi]|uniref:YcaO-like family protein n=1 Tax=Roseomonas elaeocarpi TaxID=907779 RepID=A0ABV6JUI6_9PROT
MSLEDVAVAFRESLPAESEISVFRIDALDRTGIPVSQANLLLPDEPATTGYGYGFEPIEAEVGALGELCEEVHAGKAVARIPAVTGSYGEMVRQHGRRGVVDPMTLCLSAGSDYTDELPLRWVEGRRYPSDESVWVPREWVAAYPYQLGEAPRLITPITNGLGAGFDHAHALAHGIMELTQRDGNVVSFRALDQGVVVDPEGIQDRQVVALMERLRADGINVTVKLASADMGIPDLYVVGDDRGQPVCPIQVTACGEASHPDRERALRKALLEFAGSRARKAATHGPIELLRSVMPRGYADRQMAVAMVEEEENRALEAMTDWVAQDAAWLKQRLSNSVFSERRRVRFTDLPTVEPAAIANSTDRLNLLQGRLADEGLDLIMVDLSPPDGPVKVVRAVVPGIEMETMSYHRIGWRGVRRLRERDDPLILGAPREGAKRVMLRPADEERCGGPAWFDAALADRIVGDLYPLYREPGTFSAQMRLRQRRERGA